MNFDEADAQLLEQLAEQYGLSSSAVVRAAVRRLLTDRALFLPVPSHDAWRLGEARPTRRVNVSDLRRRLRGEPPHGRA